MGQRGRRCGDRHLFLQARAPSTIRAYVRALQDFLAWAEPEAPEATCGFVAFDAALVDYAHDLFDSLLGRCRQRVVNTIAAVQLFLPRSRPHLAGARQALQGWSRLHPSVPYPPLTWELALTIAAYLMAQGHEQLAVAVLVAFDGLLRVGELMSLRVGDVVGCGPVVTDRPDLAHLGAGVRLRSTKTGRQQFAKLQRPEVQVLLGDLCKGRAADELVFGASAGVFRRHFKDAVRAMGLHQSFTPHSLRHGGATHLYAAGLSVDEIMLRGRWAVSKSARRYIQSGVAWEISTAVDSEIIKLGVALSEDVVVGLRSLRPVRP